MNWERARVQRQLQIRFTVLSALLVVLWFTSVNAQDFVTRADKYVSGYVERRQFVGAVLVARNGKVLFEKGYGMADVTWDVPVTPQTKFNIGSLTKQFTGLAILQLAQAGKLSLDDPISRYYKDAPPAWEKITIYHLLSHTSGLPEVKNLSEFTKGIAQPYTPLELIATFRDKPLDRPPGTKRVYNNRGYYLLGYVIEQVSGVNYADYIEQHIFTPLGMKDSGYDSNVVVIKHRANGYGVEGKELHPADYVDWSIPYAAGGLYSTVDDLLRWDQALYTEELLNRKWLDRLFTPDPSGYNYGWFIDNKSGRTRTYHEGSNPGFAACLVRYPADKTFVVVLSNLEIAPARQIAFDLGSLSFGETVTAPAAQ
jgi:D-alanyl-D-alanine carboxypeptidase